MTAHRGSIKHVPALDGLRGLAVIGVVLFHADGLLVGGYLGVDLFFVLSGYLITSILVAEVERTERVDLAAFWIRRARRLFPALLALMPAIALYAFVFAKPDELASLRLDALATLAYVANWRAIFGEKSYWDLFAAPSPLAHTWSLAIEEQFYVIWPLVVTAVLVWLRRSRRTMLVVTLALLAASMAATWLLFDPDHTSRVYYGTDTRATSILAGVVLTLAMGREPKLEGWRVRALDLAGVGALAGLAYAWATLDGQDPRLYRGGFWITEALALVLIACAAAGERSLVARLLAFRPFAWAGTISYGVYLWHWPLDCVFVPERVHLAKGVLLALKLGLTLVVSLVSYEWLEMPIRTKGLPFPRPGWITAASFAAAAGIVVLATRPRLAAPPPMRVAAGGEYPTPFSVGSHALPPASQLRPGTVRVLVLGDSVSSKLGLAIRYRQDEHHAFVAERGVGNCSIMESLTVTRFDPNAHPDRNHGCAAAWVSDVEELRPDATLVVLGGGFFAQMTVAGQPKHACDAEWQEHYADRLHQLFREMSPAAGRLALATAPYPMGRWRYSGIMERVDCFNGILRRVSREANVPIVDVAAHVCPTPECNLLSDGEPIRPDGLHPDGKGAEDVARWTLGEVVRLVGDAGR